MANYTDSDCTVRNLIESDRAGYIRKEHLEGLLKKTFPDCNIKAYVLIAGKSVRNNFLTHTPS